VNSSTTVEIISGTNKETKREWEAIKVTIGDFSFLHFTKSKFELDYVKKTLAEE